MVYNIAVKGDDTYTANGLVVHNCKAFSATQSRKKGRDFGEEIMYSEGIKQRVDDLFFEYTRQIKEMRPKTFIGENVEGLVKKINQGYFVEIFDQLQDLGYRVEAAVIDASLLGVPQRRRRLIYMGVRDDLNLDPVFPTPLGYETTVQEVLPHIARVKNTKGFVSAATHASPTITASDHSIGLTANFSCGGFVETVDGEVRKYTIKELKAISGVPSDFKMIGNFKQKWERLGRIHVPIQVYYLAASLRDNVLAKL
jgi:DNA (cytosine-5)-methyltransferase 1